MSMQDPLADMLTRIRNAQMAGKTNVQFPASKVKAAVCEVLKSEGYIGEFGAVEVDGKPAIRVELKYFDGKPVIAEIGRVSRPGLRNYVGSAEIPRVRGGLGVAVISTPEGIMSGYEARRKNLGGEVVCHIW